MTSKRQKNFKIAEEEGNEEWIYSYADMMSLLLGFFIILYSLSNVDENKFSELAKEISTSFKEKVEVKKQRDHGYNKEERELRAFQMLVNLLGTNTSEKTAELIESASSEQAKLKEIEDKLKKYQENEKVEIIEGQVSSKFREINISFPAEVMFGSGKAELSQSSMGSIQNLAKALNDIKDIADILVVGHTDSIKPTAASYYRTNWELSSARAGRVADELMKFGVDAKVIRVAGMADLQPLVAEKRKNGSYIKENLIKNRRIEIKVKRFGRTFSR